AVGGSDGARVAHVRLGRGRDRLIEQVLLHETARVQVVEVEVLELRAEPLPEILLRAFGEPPQVAQRAARLRGDLRQRLPPEHHEREYREDQQLGHGQVEHVTTLAQWKGSATAARRRNPRMIRSKNPGAVFRGRDATTWLTTSGGASASIA